jgi:hypothetical protein
VGGGVTNSFYLPDFDGMRDVNKCADIEMLNFVLSKAYESQKILSGLIVAINEQKRILENIVFTYKIEYSDWKTLHIISVIKVPSNPNMVSFRVNGTYTECYSKPDALSRAKRLVYDFKERGISVEIDMEMFK